MDIPRVIVKDILHPQKVTYSREYNLSFIVDKQSNSNPTTVSVDVVSKNTNHFSFESLQNDKSFRLSFEGKDLDPGINKVVISVEHYDKNKIKYTTKKEIEIELENITVFERLQIVLRNFNLWLQDLFNKEQGWG